MCGLLPLLQHNPASLCIRRPAVLVVVDVVHNHLGLGRVDGEIRPGLRHPVGRLGTRQQQVPGWIGASAGRERALELRW
jgi:hypothetical protein